MPNYCDNEIILTHNNPKMIMRAIKAFRRNKLMTEFIPCPQELIDTMAGFCAEGYQQELLKFKQELNMKHFGYQDWCDWCYANWGTKWDVGGSKQDYTWIDAHNVKFNFQSAWCSPLNFYKHLEILGFTVIAYYFESGCAFCGMYGKGNDDYYSILECNSQWVIDNIPEDIDNSMCISQLYAEWEDDNQLETA